MITLPTELEKFMQGQDLTGLKPFALLYRNKWNAVSEKFELDSTPIDITALIAKPNTLSMTLDVNEVAQYNANNVTLSLEDTKNRFVEGTPNSYFPDGYQIYGSKVVLYYGITSPINPYPTQVGYTVVGSPTITDGVVSGFSERTNYLTTNLYLTADNNSNFEIYSKFTTGTLGSANESIITISDGTANGYLVQFRILTTKRFQFLTKKIDGTLNAAISPSYIFQDNTTYYAKAICNNLNLSLSIYDSGLNILAEVTADVPSVLLSGNFNTTVTIGSLALGYNVWNGSIDLNNTYIKVNGEYWFNGAHFFYKPQATPLFTGVIKEPPTHKPEKYQVDVKLVSPLEMLKDIEAKDFSDKVIGETLTYVEEDDDGHKVYQTTGTGVGGFDAVYADGNKLFEGVDYEVSRTNGLGISALVTIINSDYYTATITADYYTWKTGLSVEQIVAGLVGLAGYDSETEDIRNVVWNTDIRTAISPNFLFSQGYSHQGVSFNYSGAGNYSYGDTLPQMGLDPIWDWDNNSVIKSTTVFPTNFTYEIQIADTPQQAIGIDGQTTLRIGDTNKFFLFSSSRAGRVRVVYIDWDLSNWVYWYIYTTNDNKIRIEKNGTTFSFYGYEELMPEAQKTIVSDMNLNVDNNIRMMNSNAQNRYKLLLSQKLTDLQSGITLEKYGIAFELNRAEATKWANIYADKSNADAPVSVNYRTSNDGSIYSNWNTIDLRTDIGETSSIIQFTIVLNNNSNTTNFTNVGLFYLGSTLTLQLVNLTGKTVLEALQDFALISGYEFGVDRQGVFFFRPRVASTTPTYTLDGNEVVQVDTVKKSLNDFFTKLTLTFAEVPLEFYANTGTRPTAIDKYGVINKDIDKPEIVNYDNPELAQAIGPQLLEVYSALPNIIQAVGKLNLALELGDIVNLKRNLNLIADPNGTDYYKFILQQTYWRACKITGMNYNFAKRQITYTLRDVSNNNNYPPVDAYGFPYDLPIQLGKLKTE